MIQMEVAPTHQIPQISLEQLERLSRFVREQVGIKLGADKVHLVQSRLYKRIKQLDIDGFGSYLDIALNPLERESDILLDILTTNKTSFFRESAHFDFIRDTVLAEQEQAFLRGKVLRCWSAACSSGEEPYSLLISLIEAGLSATSIATILATDISLTALTNAVNGRYPASTLTGIEGGLVDRYFRVDDLNSYTVSKALRESVAFRRFNLIKGPYSFRHQFDLIFCRNVMIYFDEETKNQVVKNLIRSLSLGGYLFIGHSESLDTNYHTALSMQSPAIYRKEAEI